MARRRAGGDFDLQADQVETGDELGDRVLHLQARVHFQEVEAAVPIHQEFHRAGIVVAGGARGADGRLAHGLPHLRMERHQRRRALLDHLLMAALQRALALAQVHQVAVAVSQHLDFDVARLVDQLLDVDFGVAEGAFGFAGGIAKSRFQLRLADPRGACPCRRRRPRLSAGWGSRARGRTRGPPPGVTAVAVPGTTGAPAAMRRLRGPRSSTPWRGWRRRRAR